MNINLLGMFSEREAGKFTSPCPQYALYSVKKEERYLPTLSMVDGEKELFNSIRIQWAKIVN